MSHFLGEKCRIKLKMGNNNHIMICLFSSIKEIFTEKQ